MPDGNLWRFSLCGSIEYGRPTRRDGKWLAIRVSSHILQRLHAKDIIKHRASCPIIAVRILENALIANQAFVVVVLGEEPHIDSVLVGPRGALVV